tara:strand:- start:1918 stop:2487 length:570 start_codon:yes stop_codon:yes gene_type:complete
MAEIHEAPIVHAEISVNQITANSITFKDGTAFTNIDQALDTSSTNPLTNAAINSALANISTPDVEVFDFHAIMNPTAMHDAIGDISFPTILRFQSTFGTVTIPVPVSSISVPVTGTYAIFFKTIAYNSNLFVTTNLRINDEQIGETSSSKGFLTYSTNLQLQANDSITLYANSVTQARSELSICLLGRS